MMNSCSNHKGSAMLTTLYVSVIIIGISGLFLSRSINAGNAFRKGLDMSKALYCANAGAQAALSTIDTLINDYLYTTISSANPSGVINYTNARVNQGDGLGWLVYSVRSSNTPVLTVDGDQAGFTGSGTAGDLSYQFAIVFTEKDDPSSVSTDVWEFPFNYAATATGSADGVSSSVTIHGDFTVRVQRDNFAKYALFTNTQTTTSGVNVWFTNKTNFAGPLHTNDRFNFALNPSGTFETDVAQYQPDARFYNLGWPVLLDDDHNQTRDVPVFHGNFTRGADTITLSSSTNETDMKNQATGNRTFADDGIYVPAQGSQLDGAIYVKGSAALGLSVDGNNRAVYTITQGSQNKQITVDPGSNQTSVYDVSTGQTDTYTGLPDGVDDAGTLIFVDGQMQSLGGIVESHTEVTVASSSDIIISDHLKYETYTPAVGAPGDAGYVPPNADGSDNILGIVSWNGNVRVGTSAPDNVEVHGSIMSQSGVFSVDDYTNQGRGPRGTATLLGGAITNNYGAFGLFSGSTGQQLSGYGRNFVYDERMQMGKAPPYYPSLNAFIAFSNDIVDKMIWQEGE